MLFHLVEEGFQGGGYLFGPRPPVVPLTKRVPLLSVQNVVRVYPGALGVVVGHLDACAC